MTRFLAAAAQYSLKAIPVFSLADTGTVSKHAWARFTRTGRIALRVEETAMASAIGRLQVLDFLAAAGKTPNGVHLVVDRGHLADDVPPLKLMLTIAAMGSWASTTVLGGSFPKDLTHLSAGTYRLPRREWLAYRDLCATWPDSLALPNFGDYTTQHALYEEPPVFCSPSASVRYALESEWLVLRGHSRKVLSPATPQFNGHAIHLTEAVQPKSAIECYGDDFIRRKAMSGASPGNFEDWLAASVNRHLSLTAHNIASLRVAGVRAINMPQFSRAEEQAAKTEHHK
jgi:hypothetical protein